MARRRRERAVRALSAALMSVGLIVLTGVMTVTPTARAAASGAESAGGTAVTAAYTGASTSAPCVVSINTAQCQSTDPNLTDDWVSNGDTAGCTFTWSINWGDGSLPQPFTVDGKSQSGEYFFADHTYHATQTQTYSVTITDVSVTGDCTIGGATFTFTLDVAGTAPPSSGEACVFNAPSTAEGLIGHVAWGFRLPNGYWEFGANEGPGKRYTSKTWARIGSHGAMLNTFRNGGPYHSTGYYTTVECVTVPTFNATAAQQEAGYEQDQKYILVFQDCESQAYNVLSKYGVSSLPNDILHPVPNSWYNDLTTSAGFGPPTSL
jgi:hypothetical protein